jgi:hypothetical protein
MIGERDDPQKPFAATADGHGVYPWRIRRELCQNRVKAREEIFALR